MVKSLMVQGTASDAGKSIIAAGLCRIFKQDGLEVVPFKSQNMALNSFITKKGDEMGRAQVVQAEAAGKEPDVRMNPVLLKPTSDRKSQVVFLGSVLRDMDAVEYHEYKQQLLPKIKEVYEELGAENDIIVIEGAGSPAEINLNDRDIVNMGMAKLVDAPVILVADIDKGGVFASIYGTIELMPPEDRKRIKGVIINKFRGDVALLQSGIDMIEELTQVPVIGVVPYAQLDIDSEDSVALVQKSRRFDSRKSLDIAIVSLKRLSNFTDFHSLEIQPDVSVRYVQPGDAIGRPDLLILPGSKNTIEDMNYLRESGLEAEILECLEQGVRIFGICGGYQMLGKVVRDPLHTESEHDETAGFGYLPSETTFAAQKRLRQVTASADFSFLGAHIFGRNLLGYEIHMGQTDFLEKTIRPFHIAQEDNFVSDGAVSSDGLVIGTYIHGIFDDDDFRRSLLNRLRVQRGWSEIPVQYRYREEKERAYDRLAETVRASLDMEKLQAILEGDR